MGRCYHRKVLYICKYDGVKYFQRAQKDPPFEAVCENCRMVMSLGHSYDSPSEVKIEILAAEVGQNADVWRRFVTNDGGVAADLERIGAFGTLELGTSSIYAHHAYLDPPPRWTRWEMNDYWSGWLAREMASERDAPDAWPWDITRPVAGQYEEWMEKRKELTAAIDRFEKTNNELRGHLGLGPDPDVIAEQTRRPRWRGMRTCPAGSHTPRTSCSYPTSARYPSKT